MADVVRSLGTATSGAGTGLVSCSATTAVTGSGTSFTTELSAPGTIEISGTLYDIASITDNTNLTLTANGPSVSSVAFNIGARDYSTLTAWEADLDDTGVYSSTNNPVAQLYSDSEFQELCVVNGGATSGITALTIQSHPDHRHDGTEGTGTVYSIGTPTSAWMQIATPSACVNVVEWIEFDGNHIASGNNAIGLSSNTTTVRNNIIHHHDGSHFDTDATLRPAGTYQPIHVINNIFYNNKDYNYYTNVGHGIDIYLRNNTAWACDGGFRGINRTDKWMQNNLAIASSIYNDFDALTGVNADHNASSDASAVDQPSGSTSLNSGTTPAPTASSEFVSTSPVDLTLKSGAASIGAGADFSAMGYGIEVDIKGNTRSGTWDIGAHQYQSAGGSSVVPSLLLRNQMRHALVR